MAACTEKVKSGRFIYFFAGRMGGFPAVQACEGTPLGERLPLCAGDELWEWSGVGEGDA